MPQPWPQLGNPPIVLAVVEINFNLPDNFDVSDIRKYDFELLKLYPHRQDNLKGRINIPNPLAGISTAQITSKHVGNTYTDEAKLRRVVVSRENLVFMIEGKYPGWEEFYNEGIKAFSYLSNMLKNIEIIRTSIRFINKITVSDLSSPLDYFNTFIAARKGAIKNPIDTYFYRYTQKVPKTNIVANIINSIEEMNQQSSTFVFDIDVLCYETYKFDLKTTSKYMEDLREIKNRIFFDNITEKTKALLS